MSSQQVGTSDKARAVANADALNRPGGVQVDAVLRIAAVAGVVALGVIGLYFLRFAGEGFSPKQDHWGQFGDYIGGTINPVFAFSSFLALLFTLSLQAKQLALSEKQLEASREELRLTREEMARATQAQQQLAEQAEKTARAQEQVALVMVDQLLAAKAAAAAQERAAIAQAATATAMGTAAQAQALGAEIQALGAQISESVLRGFSEKHGGADLPTAAERRVALLAKLGSLTEGRINPAS